MADQKEDPYLAYLPPSQGGTGSSVLENNDNEPLFGFLPRKVTASQVRKALVRSNHQRFKFPTDSSWHVLLCFQEHDVNPFTKVPHTPQYKKLLDTRKKLPVYAQMDAFYKMVRQ